MFRLVAFHKVLFICRIHNQIACIHAKRTGRPENPPEVPLPVRPTLTSSHLSHAFFPCFLTGWSSEYGWWMGQLVGRLVFSPSPTSDHIILENQLHSSEHLVLGIASPPPFDFGDMMPVTAAPAKGSPSGPSHHSYASDPNTYAIVPSKSLDTSTQAPLPPAASLVPTSR